MTVIQRFIPYALTLFFVFILAGCQSEKSSETGSVPKRYSIYAMMDDGSEYIVETDSIISGSIDPSETGTKVPFKDLWSDLIVKDGCYYRLDWKSETFIKYQIKNAELKEVASVKLTNFSFLENYNWLTADTLLLITYNRDAKLAGYAKVDVKLMTAVQNNLPIAAPFGPFNWMSLGFSEFKDQKLLVGYTYHTINQSDHYTTSDTAYVAVLTYPELTLLKTEKDIRSTYPGGINTEQPFTFTDEKGDFYFIACPGIALGNNSQKPTGIFRIKKGTDDLDPDYFFNISASPIQNHGYALWYLGGGKAIVRTERKGIFTGMKDHYKVAHLDFYEVDINSQTTRRLDLPLDKGSARQCLLREGNVAYITTNSDAEGNFVWTFDIKKGKLQKGLKFTSNVDYILRIDKLR